jgi:hypothetical protein
MQPDHSSPLESVGVRNTPEESVPLLLLIRERNIRFEFRLKLLRYSMFSLSTANHIPGLFLASDYEFFLPHPSKIMIHQSS